MFFRAPWDGRRICEATCASSVPQVIAGISVGLAGSLAEVGLRFWLPSFDSCLYLVVREEGGAAGAFTSHFGDICGCGEQDVPTKLRAFSQYRPGRVGVQESLCVHVGAEVPLGGDFSIKLPLEEFTRNPKPLITSPGLGAAPRRTESPEAIKSR